MEKTTNYSIKFKKTSIDKIRTHLDKIKATDFYGNKLSLNKFIYSLVEDFASKLGNEEQIEKELYEQGDQVGETG